MFRYHLFKNFAMKKIALIGLLTPEGITKLKADHSPLKIFGIEVGGHIGYFREPDLDDLNIAASEADSDTPLEFNRIVMRECFVDGSDAVINDNRLYLSASKIMSKRIDGEKAKLVEL